MTRILIHVTRADIARGVVEDPDRCPVALALRRQGFSDAWVVETSLHFPLWPRGARTVTAPRSVRRFVRRFDTHKDVAPFSFRLEEPA